MKRAAALAAVAALAMSGVASAQLSKADARLTAETTAYSYFSHQAWIASTQIGACKRLTPNRVTCKGKATGDQHKGCDVEEEGGLPTGIACTAIYHACQFSVVVHKAGYGSLGRVRGVSCTEHEHPEFTRGFA